MRIRFAPVMALAVLAACSSKQPAEDKLVTLDAPGAAVSEAAAGAPVARDGSSGLQAVTAEGSKLEPLVSSAISAAGLDSGACRFSPAPGALPVLAASKAGGQAIASLAGRQIMLAATGIGAPGGSASGEGITLTVTASAGAAAASGGQASMVVNDADGPAFTYQDGYWACN